MTTLHHGAQVDHVTELEVVTGEAAVLTCSKSEHRDLFEAVLAGQGQCAIITRAVLTAIAAPAMVREYGLQYDSVETLLEDELGLLHDGRFAGVVAFIEPANDGWSFTLSASHYFTPPEAPNDTALTTGLRAVATHTRDVEYSQHVAPVLHVPTQGAHADLGLMIPASAARTFVGETLPRLRADDLGAVTRVRLFAWNRKVFSRALFRVPNEETFIYAALLRAETADASMIARMLTGNRMLFDANRERGGVHYPYSALELTRTDWQRHYGDAWRQLARAKHRYDPAGVFASGPDLFG
jgi:FAD/FMN-containing dehydrogenase